MRMLAGNCSYSRPAVRHVRSQRAFGARGRRVFAWVCGGLPPDSGSDCGTPRVYPRAIGSHAGYILPPLVRLVLTPGIYWRRPRPLYLPVLSGCAARPV
eukprot:1196381-Prorocentrum_minimum.AAC.3